MNISYNWLRELTGVELTADELRERLTMAGLEVEAVHEMGGDFVLEIAMLSNRPDLLSHLGVAREVCTLAGGAVRWPKMQALREEGRTGVLPRLKYKRLICARASRRASCAACKLRLRRPGSLKDWKRSGSVRSITLRTSRTM
jgi:phenylalanyl-tRNA synthetase beta subunit